MDIQELEERREQILSEMQAMRSMRRGSITEQYLKDKRKKGQPVTRGPYYVFSRREDGRTVSRRLKPGPDLEQARREVAAHQRFVELCQEFERLTERLGELERDSDRQEKKRHR